jgi:hypothetical protein
MSFPSLLLTGVSLLGITSLLSQSAQAIPLASVLLSQTTPPDIIIDTDPQTSNDPVPTATTNNADPRFTCEFYQGEYTVMYSPISQPDQMYPWATPQQMGGGWNPERRCNAISQRLETYRSDGLLALDTRREGNYDIVCVTTQANSSCRIVFTVPPGQNAEVTRDRVFDNLLVADSGEQTQSVTTFTGNGNDILGQIGGLFGVNRPSAATNRNGSINLRPFLDQADGGTATQLHSTPNNVPNATDKIQLNPDNFR